MRAIKELADRINEELEDAKFYSEKYVEAKAKGDTTNAARFKDIANDELRHASIIHEMAVQEIATVRKIFTPPVEMEEKWSKTHREYMERAAWVKQMLAM
jgi:ferritin